MKVLNVFDGMLVSQPALTPKGVGMRVMIPKLGDCYRVFVPSEQVKGEQTLNLGDNVKVNYCGMYPSNNEIRMNVENILLDTAKK